MTPIHLMNNNIGVGSTTDAFGTKASMTQKPIEVKIAIYNPRWSIISFCALSLTLLTNAHRAQHNTLTKLHAIGMMCSVHVVDSIAGATHQQGHELGRARYRLNFTGQFSQRNGVEFQIFAPPGRYIQWHLPKNKLAIFI